MPALARGAFSAPSVDSATLTAGVVMSGMPTAVSTFVFATTLASVGTLFVPIRLAGAG